MKYAVGIDVGGTNTRVALINDEYKIVERVQFSTDTQNPQVTLEKINNVIIAHGGRNSTHSCKRSVIVRQ